jgi:hypothetical protein
MTWAIVVDTWVRLARSPLRLAIAAMFIALPVTEILLAGEGRLPQLAFQLTCCVAAGIIGQETASGTLRLVLSRPVPRWRLVLARWLACTAAGWALAVVSITVSLAALAVAGGNDVLARSLATPRMFLSFVFVAGGTAGILTFFSCLVPRFGDLALLLAGLVLTQAFVEFLPDSVAHLVRDHVKLALTPALPSFEALDVFRSASTTAACLLAAVLVLNARQLERKASS